MRGALHAAIAASVLTLTACGGNDDPEPAGSTVAISGAQATASPSAGAMTGTAGDAVVSFKGIPFAQPPVGALRWRPPVAAARWSGNRDAADFAKHCPQENAQADVNAEEDCLYLNVYAPRAVAGAGTTRRPVMVWIHGGANAFGASDFYDPTALVSTGDVLVVTVNYRLGALGFLAHPALRADGARAVNYGVMDQQLALQWVRDNIGAFGGDPGNVTLFGESAGGLNVTTHLASDDSRGLFHKAIIESGGYLLETPSLDQADAKGAAFATRIGCTTDVATCLRGKTVAEVLANEGVVNTDSAAYHQMAVDGQVLKEMQSTAIYSGRFHRVPVLLGANRNEGNLFFGSSANQATYDATVNLYSTKNHRTPDWTRTVYPIGSYANAFEASSAVLGDAEFACPARRTSQWFSNYVPTYAYEFHDPASLVNSGHFAEIYYLFQFRGQTGFGVHGGADSRALATAMQRYWSNFARSGNPNGTGSPTWRPYLPHAQSLQLLVAPTPMEDTAPAGSDYVARHRCDFWGVQ